MCSQENHLQLLDFKMAITDLIAPWLVVDELSEQLSNITVGQLELDSRRVKSGTTFVAVIGHQVDGRKFIANVIKQGANAVLAEADKQFPHGLIEWHTDTPVIYLQNLGAILSLLAGRLYGQVDDKTQKVTHQQMGLIGVTGTNGKTTITQLMAQWLTLSQLRSAVMGTTGNGFLDALQPAVNTTGSALEIQQTLANLAAQQAVYTALEISSHGLVQGRIQALDFAAGVFTNLSRDHLDYHGTMQAYAEAKLTLFTEHQCRHAIINIDDPVGLSWLVRVPNAIAVSLTPPIDLSLAKPALWATNIEYRTSGITIKFAGFWGEGKFTAPLIGEFNASNLLLALATLLSLGLDKQQLIDNAALLQPVLGRMELFQTAEKNSAQAKVVVDYAHTPDALEKALQALRVHCQGQLWTIVGCGGDRDTGKRPMMAEIAERLGEHVILSDDNPRSESPELIIAAMQAGMAHPEQAVVMHDRYQALQHALNQANSHDIILVAGKGHEDYQIFADGKVHYSDRESAMQLLGISND